MKQLYPAVEPTKDFDKIVGDKEVDAVVVPTPVHLHHELAKKALQAGKHAFVEKPMTQTAEQANELVQIAAKKKLTLMVGHTFIYSAPVRRIKEIVKSGDLGEVQYIASRRLNLGLFQKDINVAWDLAPHDISIILDIMGETPLSVNCQGSAHVTPGIEDVTNMSLDFENGGFATIHSSWLDPNKVREMIIVGSNRMIVYDDNEQQHYLELSDLHYELEQRVFQWQAEFDKTCLAVQDVIRDLESNASITALGLQGEVLPNQIDLNYWSDGKYQQLLKHCNKFFTYIVRDQQSHSIDDLVRIYGQVVPAIRESFESIIYDARIRALSSQLRMNIAEKALHALEVHGYRLSNAGYVDCDMRSTFRAHLDSQDGSEVTIKVLPVDASADRSQRGPNRRYPTPPTGTRSAIRPP